VRGGAHAHQSGADSTSLHCFDAFVAKRTKSKRLHPTFIKMEQT
jgi:hypothetical protein